MRQNVSKLIWHSTLGPKSTENAARDAKGWGYPKLIGLDSPTLRAKISAPPGGRLQCRGCVAISEDFKSINMRMTGSDFLARQS